LQGLQQVVIGTAFEQLHVKIVFELVQRERADVGIVADRSLQSGNHLRRLAGYARTHGCAQGGRLQEPTQLFDDCNRCEADTPRQLSNNGIGTIAVIWQMPSNV
jgi:hypothetical protein